MAELVDALASGASGFMVVGVRVPLSAPFFVDVLRYSGYLFVVWNFS